LKGKKTMALATSSHPKDALSVLKALGFEYFFSYVASKNSIEKVKPHPDIFLHVAKEINTPPEKCLVIEDAEKGILAADAAGMKSIAVPNKYTMDNDFSKATVVLDSLEEINCELIDQL
jgi:HAD superfamily hydrolase (TIGR01509 family)